MSVEATPANRLLLHTCCGPCLIEPLDALRAEAREVVVLFANPNIRPAEEYVRRRDTLAAYARHAGVEIVEAGSDRDEWDRSVAVFGANKRERCRACYRLRLEFSASFAAKNGFDAIATTLTVSPYQDHIAINEEGSRAATGAGVTWLERDFRDRYRTATSRARELGMYRQNYCGCEFSIVEAEADRRARRASRIAEKAAGNTAGTAGIGG